MILGYLALLLGRGPFHERIMCMTMVKTMIKTKKNSSVSLAITTSGPSPPVLTLTDNGSKEDARCDQVLIDDWPER